MPGATVTVKDSKTGKEFTVTTDEGAAFKVSNLEIGSFTVTVTAVRANRKTTLLFQPNFIFLVLLY
ncbi:MAG: carboxypeptidase-like regulatory domain-containing protein [Acidobacteriota bacterium]|nr:carboxypeptidase-like regulatory domain-containing protein [Acidobacteriota bacterium]